MRKLFLPIVLGVPLALGGCLPMMAMSAAEMAISSARGPTVSNADFKPEAEAACTAQANQYGAVHVIDVQQAKVNLIIVWGTVGEGAAKRSFECHFGTKVTSFTLRAITPAQ